MNSYFIIRLKDKSHIDDIYKITENDTEIELELTKEGLKKFHNRPKRKIQQIKTLKIKNTKNNTRKQNNRILINQHIR